MEWLHLRFCRWLYTRDPRVRELTWFSIHTYRLMSIKNAETTVRGEVHGVQVAHFCAYQLVKQWRKFLSEVLKEQDQFVGIWRRSLEANPSIPSPDGMGWSTQISCDASNLLIDWMDKKPAPEVVHVNAGGSVSSLAVFV